MKVIFLDIDGVLNSNRTSLAYKGYPDSFNTYDKGRFDWTAIRLIDRLVSNNEDVHVVISSSWRYNFKVSDFANAFGFDVLGTTPKHQFGRDRGEEIKEWLDKNNNYNVTHYAIIDDQGGMLPEQLEHFVKVDEKEGLLYKDYARVCSILDVKL